MNLLKRFNQRGDTIVEVMICLAIFAGMLSAAYVLTNKNQTTSQAAQERSAAVKVAEGQLEKLKAFVDDSEIPEFDYFCMEGNGTPTELEEAAGGCSSAESEGRYTSLIYSPAKATEIGGNGNVFAVKTTWEGAITADEEVKIFYALYDDKNTIEVAGGGSEIIFNPPVVQPPPPEPEPEPEVVTTSVNGADFSDCGFYYGGIYGYYYGYPYYYYYGYDGWEDEDIELSDDYWSSDSYSCYPIGPYDGYENSMFLGYSYGYSQSQGVEYQLDFKKGKNLLTIDYDASYSAYYYEGMPVTIAIGNYTKNVVLPGGGKSSHTVELDIPDDVGDLSKLKIIFWNDYYYYYYNLIVINKITVNHQEGS